jgi:hypothetical protein
MKANDVTRPPLAEPNSALQMSGVSAMRGLGGLRWLRAGGWVIYALAVLMGAVYGYRFGFTVSGMPFGLLTAAMAALFCSILADAAIGHRLKRRG